jgi:hypothetical protein
MNKSPSSSSLYCLIVCTCYKKQISQTNQLLDCFIEAINSSKSFYVIMGIQAFIISLSNLPDEIQTYIPLIILHLTKKLSNDIYISKIILEFLMRKLFHLHY